MVNATYPKCYETEWALLSSFLPQDKVAEFAQMNPQELLRATQKAAGNEHLIKWHDALIEIGKALKKLSEVEYSSI